MCEVSGGGGGGEEDKYHDHSKETRNVDSLKEYLKVRSADSAELLYQNHLDKWFLKMQDSGSHSTVPEFQSFGAGGGLAICILANTSISTAC